MLSKMQVKTEACMQLSWRGSSDECCVPVSCIFSYLLIRKGIDFFHQTLNCNVLKYLKKFREHSVATALASNVLPVPGAPYSKIPDE